MVINIIKVVHVLGNSGNKSQKRLSLSKSVLENEKIASVAVVRFFKSIKPLTMNFRTFRTSFLQFSWIFLSLIIHFDIF